MLSSSPKKTLIGAAVAAGLLSAPSLAPAATTASFDGSKVTVVGTEGADGSSLQVYEGRLYVRGTGAAAGPGCTADEYSGEVSCPVPAGGVDVSLLGGDDEVHNSTYDAPAGFVRVDLGAGNDSFETSGGDTVQGGPGNDEITAFSQAFANVFEGGDGNDKLSGERGADVLRGGAGDDTLKDDSYGEQNADVVDGGPGRDTVDAWSHPDAYNTIPATVTLDGVADDGYPGEGDNVTDVETIKVASGIVFRGTDAPEVVIAAEVGHKGSMQTLGGDDQLSGSDDDETLDAGAGNDDIKAGYGNDTIVAGPGTDKVVADRDGRCNEYHCDLSPGSAADTVDVVDGERDVVACGPGNDSVKADAIDEVAPDCESVTRTGGGGGGGGPVSGGGPGGNPVVPAGPGGGGAALAVKGARSLKALKAGRLKVVVPGVQPGAKVTVKARRAGKVLAAGSGRADTAGDARVTLRLTKAGRRALRRARSATLTISAGALTATVRLGR
jgi:Ca2+-binding RTX toxin-like protein